MTSLGKGQCQVWKHGNSRFHTDDYNLPSHNDSFGESKLKIWLAFNEMGLISQFWQESKARLVANFKHHCLKWYKKCGLKSVVKTHVYSVHKTKIHVWYHVSNNMFLCLKNIIMCLVCMCLIFKKLTTRYKFNIYYLTREKKSAYFTVALILLPLFLLFPFSTLKLLIPSSLSNTKPTPSHSSSPSTQTKIQGWASFSFESHLHCLQSKT